MQALARDSDVSKQGRRCMHVWQANHGNLLELLNKEKVDSEYQDQDKGNASGLDVLVDAKDKQAEMRLRQSLKNIRLLIAKNKEMQQAFLTLFQGQQASHQAQRLPLH